MTPLEPIVLDLDGSVASQAAGRGLRTLALTDWGGRIRLACGFGRFAVFERHLQAALAVMGERPRCVLGGSGDFHHVSLALCRLLPGPVNLLVLDKHPDWVSPVPLLHCGTWLAHACRLGQIHRVFHVGGDMDFDSFYRHMAPWPALRAGKIVVFPARRRYTAGRWREIDHQPLRVAPDVPATSARLAELLEPYRRELAERPLYVSLDKDVLSAAEAAVNWDSGHLRLEEALTTIEAFGAAAGGHCAGMDIWGDWSAWNGRGVFRPLLDRLEHPRAQVDAAGAAAINSATNQTLLARLGLLGERNARGTALQP